MHSSVVKIYSLEIAHKANKPFLYRLKEDRKKWIMCFLPAWEWNLPVDCENPMPLFTKHWYNPVSSGAIWFILSLFPEGKCREERWTGIPLWYQVTVGKGFPCISHDRCKLLPQDTNWFCNPLDIEAGSKTKEEKRKRKRKHYIPFHSFEAAFWLWICKLKIVIVPSTFML